MRTVRTKLPIILISAIVTTMSCVSVLADSCATSDGWNFPIELSPYYCTGVYQNPNGSPAHIPNSPVQITFTCVSNPDSGYGPNGDSLGLAVSVGGQSASAIFGYPCGANYKSPSSCLQCYQDHYQSAAPKLALCYNARNQLAILNQIMQTPFNPKNPNPFNPNNPMSGQQLPNNPSINSSAAVNELTKQFTDLTRFVQNQCNGM